MKTSIVGPTAIADRMRWLQARTKVLAENVANADTAGFVPRDLASPAQAARLTPVATDARHIGGAAGQGRDHIAARRLETRPSGNAVNLEDEMLKLSETQLEYQMMTGLYQRSLGVLKTAIGRRG